MIRFAAILVTARQLAGQTAAEFDYAISRGDVDLGAFGPYGYLNLAASQLGGGAEQGKALLQQHQTELDEMVNRAKAKSYTGWSAASSGPIRYAS